jgi:ectoine hydroxylase-related dioxygenase (phytanoyl-CoA dioxygenase family)
MAGSLSAEQIDAFWNDGFFFPVAAISSADALAARQHFLKLMDEPAVTLPRPTNDYARSCFHAVSTEAARLAAHPAILDAVESLLGPDLLVWSVELIIKPPQSDKMLTMHQDLNYWGFEHADGEVTAWLALGDVTIENGAMQFVRASHRLGAVAHHDTYGENNLLSRGQEIAVDFDPADEVPVELGAGDISLHHGLTFHGSGPNTTDHHRVALAIRYVTPEMGKQGGATDYAMLVRGADRHNKLVKIAPPATDFGPAELALHTELEAAQLDALAAGAGEAYGYGRGT